MLNEIIIKGINGFLLSTSTNNIRPAVDARYRVDYTNSYSGGRIFDKIRFLVAGSIRCLWLVPFHAARTRMADPSTQIHRKQD